MPKLITDQEFLDAWERFKSASAVANHFSLHLRGVNRRRRALEDRYSLSLRPNQEVLKIEYDRVRAIMDVDGYVVVFSDAHFMPETSPAFDALIKVIKRLKPKVVIANGDILDAGSISKFGPMDWSPTISLRDELEAVQDHMTKIAKACKGFGTILHRTIGNHDQRFDRKLAGMVPEYKGIAGTCLKDHLPEWTVSWSVMVNDICMIKHRLQYSGIHSSYNNVLKSGLSTCSGHTHLLEVKGWGDYTGRRYGISTGMLADPANPSFRYLEDNPVPWCSGFAVLRFYDGILMPPELCEVIDGVAYFRGESV
jgi:hypothetical protein